jgi:hypothetical protein
MALQMGLQMAPIIMLPSRTRSCDGPVWPHEVVFSKMCLHSSAEVHISLQHVSEGNLYMLGKLAISSRCSSQCTCHVDWGG